MPAGAGAGEYRRIKYSVIRIIEMPAGAGRD